MTQVFRHRGLSGHLLGSSSNSLILSMIKSGMPSPLRSSWLAVASKQLPFPPFPWDFSIISRFQSSSLARVIRLGWNQRHSSADSGNRCITLLLPAGIWLRISANQFRKNGKRASLWHALAPCCFSMAPDMWEVVRQRWKHDVVGAVLCGASRNMLVCCVFCFVARTVLMSLWAHELLTKWMQRPNIRQTGPPHSPIPSPLLFILFYVSTQCFHACWHVHLNHIFHAHSAWLKTSSNSACTKGVQSLSLASGVYLGFQGSLKGESYLKVVAEPVPSPSLDPCAELPFSAYIPYIGLAEATCRSS